MSKTFEIELGPLCRSLSVQLAGLVSDKDAQALDLDSSAINRAVRRGYMPANVAERARKKLVKRCQQAVIAHAKLQARP